LILGFELRADTLSHSTNPFLLWFFWDRVSWTICPGWLRIEIFPISASWEARVTGLSHQGPAWWHSLMAYRQNHLLSQSLFQQFIILVVIRFSLHLAKIFCVLI
jgi:hypothetical protein